MGKQIVGGLAALLLAATLSAPAAPATAAGACKNIAHRAMQGQTEEQVRGVARNARWGFTEVDARITADNRVVAIHDFSMSRISGGRSRAQVGDLTMSEIRNQPYEFGRRVETTSRLIREASRTRSAIMVTINSYARYREAWNAHGLRALWRAAQAHRTPSKVYFGGAGGERAMRLAHPRASTFHRYEGRTTRAAIRAHADDNGVDLAALPKRQFNRRLVNQLQNQRIRVATVQLDRARHVRKANAAGIRLVQTDRARRTVRRWCR